MSHLPSVNAIRGRIFSLDLADPAPGASFSVTVPDRRLYIVHAIHFNLVTATGGSARRVSIDFRDNGTHFFESESALGISGNSSVSFTAADFGGLPATPTTLIPIFMPPIPLHPGNIILATIRNEDPDDQLTNAHLHIEEFALGD